MKRISLQRLVVLTGMGLLLLVSCGPPRMSLEELAVQKPDFVVVRADSLIRANKDQPEAPALIAKAFVSVADSIVKSDPRSDKALLLYNRAHSLDPKNPDAEYGAYLIKGRRFYKKGGKDDIWDGIEAFAKAAQYHPDSGIPVLWMARSYYKEDHQDFEMIIETYNKALNLTLPDDLQTAANKELADVLKQKKILDDFWK